MLHRVLPLLALLSTPALAEPWRAEYALTLAGVRVMEAYLTFDIDSPRYSVETRVRSRGVAAMISRGEQVTRSEGSWRGNEPVPLRHASQGHWRGTARQVTIDYVGGEPRVALLEPAVDMPRTPIPPGNLRGTVDTLTALAGLVRTVNRTGRCEGTARMFDARRLSHFTARTHGQGEAGLHCTVESRQLGGIPTERDPETSGQPQLVEAWFARPQEGAPAVPLRVQLASRWWGRIEATLVRLERAPG
ncbi:MAG TPA: DUF3108 domain-containing protein [Roseococcus sp.]|jgi:hypothetical protein|nr:DUF3108 domain-containing protein [Roseococcus sp.]